MRKRVLSIALASIMVAAAFTGCGNPEVANDTAVSEAPAADNT